MTDHNNTVSPIPLELDTKLRLLPQQLNLGKAELLTDALTLPFTDIESRLGHYALSASDEEVYRLGKRMKSYLGRLNANPHIPLKFRLQVLNRFEQELDLFDADMTAAVLNAHKIGVTLVQQAALSDRSYYPVLVDMVASAMELAVKLLLINMQAYRAPSVIVTRQFFDLARLGLSVANSMGDTAPLKTARLQKALCGHEMARKIDFFANSRTRQQQIWQELQCHIGALSATLQHQGDQPESHNSGPFLLVNLNRPNDPGRMIERPPDSIAYDCILIRLDKFCMRLNKAISSVEAVLHDPQMQKKALHTESALENTLVGGQAVLDAIRTKKRSNARQRLAGTKVCIRFNLARAFTHAFATKETLLSPAGNTPEPGQPDAWNLLDYSATGLCLERLHTQMLPDLPGHLVGLKWIFADQNSPMLGIANKKSMRADASPTPALGFIRWSKILKSGEQRIGIECFGTSFKLAKAVMPGVGRGMDDKRRWPVLVRPGKSAHSIIFPDTAIYKHMTFMVSQGGQHAYFKIRAITDAGQNYTQCEIIPAKAR